MGSCVNSDHSLVDLYRRKPAVTATQYWRPFHLNQQTLPKPFAAVKSEPIICGDESICASATDFLCTVHVIVSRVPAGSPDVTLPPFGMRQRSLASLNFTPNPPASPTGRHLHAARMGSRTFERIRYRHNDDGVFLFAFEWPTNLTEPRARYVHTFRRKRNSFYGGATPLSRATAQPEGGSRGGQFFRPRWCYPPEPCNRATLRGGAAGRFTERPHGL
jgi:hypothetical protein